LKPGDKTVKEARERIRKALLGAPHPKNEKDGGIEAPRSEKANQYLRALKPPRSDPKVGPPGMQKARIKTQIYGKGPRKKIKEGPILGTRDSARSRDLGRNVTERRINQQKRRIKRVPDEKG